MNVVTDTGPVLHLHWVGASAWALPPKPVLVVEAVWREVQSYVPLALQEPRLVRVTASPMPDPRMAGYHLDPGESEALRYALSLPPDAPRLVLCDEVRARRACRELFLPVTGSVGLIVAAFRAGRTGKAAAARALRALPKAGRMYISRALVEQAVAALNADAQT